jgi:hypothetical protein
MTVLRSIFNFLYEIILGCSHQHLTRPFTLQNETYKVCLDCGKQIYYSAVTMRPLNVREVRRLMSTRAGEVRVMPSNSPTLVPSSAQKSNAA